MQEGRSTREGSQGSRASSLGKDPETINGISKRDGPLLLILCSLSWDTPRQSCEYGQPEAILPRLPGSSQSRGRGGGEEAAAACQNISKVKQKTRKQQQGQMEAGVKVRRWRSYTAFLEAISKTPQE